ncbi:MAG: type I-F CRISPR-associated endoribonuclease Cas6/Csy4 [Giesbergeria sp.]|nr:type I-F CRISPR-associated endoribonuclease Cas6/Csy4 [Giesbergeria sp.]
MATSHPLSHYIELHLRLDPEVAPTHLLAALYTRLHRALAAQGTTSIAVSFPDYSAERHTLGERLRLHGSEADLQPWATGEWLGSVRDHVNATPLLPVPADTQHRTLRRVQVKSSPERLRRRLMKRHSLTQEQASERIPDSLARTTPLPYVQLASTSTAQQFRLFLALGAAQEAAQTGCFNAYGLSTTATIPWF